jgi:hypothetical protein
MIHSNTQQLSANHVQGVPAAPISSLSDKHERFVQEYVSNGGNLSEAYRAVYPACTDREAVWSAACRLRARTDVRARIADLTCAAAERALVKPEQLMRELQEIVDADATELSRVVACACSDCWTPEAFAAAYGAHLAAKLRGDATTEPDMSQPRPGCPAHPRKHRAVIFTPTDQLSAPARRLIRSVRAKGDDIDVQVIDQFAARQELHTLRKMRITQSVTAHVSVDPSKPNPWSDAEQTPDQILARAMRARRSRTEPVVTVEQLPANEAAPDSAP